MSFCDDKQFLVEVKGALIF